MLNVCLILLKTFLKVLILIDLQSLLELTLLDKFDDLLFLLVQVAEVDAGELVDIGLQLREFLLVLLLEGLHTFIILRFGQLTLLTEAFQFRLGGLELLLITLLRDSTVALAETT